MKYKVFLNRGASKSLAGLEKGQRGLMAERLKGLEDLPNTQLDTVKIASEDDTFMLRFGEADVRVS